MVLRLDLYVEQPDRPDLPTVAQWQTWGERWLTHLEDYLPEAIAYEMTLRFTDDGEIRQLNAQYRHQNRPTDVLSFATLEDEHTPISETEPLYLGDIIISLETAQRQAPGGDLRLELQWLTCHGLLHLLGWDHPDDASLNAMIAEQQDLLGLENLCYPWEQVLAQS